MKKAFIAMFAGTLVFTASTTFAQENTYAANVNPVAYRIADYTPARELSASAVNNNALTDFSKKNKEVSNVTWTTNNKLFSVYFNKDGVKMRSTYDEKGKWQYTISHLTAKQAPYKVREAVSQHYPGLSIKQVTEVKKQGSVFHLVQVEDKTSYLTLQVLNGEVDLFEKINN